MIDMKALSNELTEAFILREYRLVTPMFGLRDFTKEAIHCYQNEPIFHRRIDIVVAGIMQIITKHEK